MKIAFITDIHEDIVNLTETFRKIEKYHVDEIYCLGDISGFSLPYYKYLNTRNAHECLSLIRSNCKNVIIGNHDMHAAQIIPKDCSFFNFPDNWYQLDYHDRRKICGNILWLHEEGDLNPLYKETDLDYIRSLPEYFIIKTPGFNILLTHYVFPNISGLKREFYTYGDEFQQHLRYMESLDCTIGFTGHSHIRGLSMTTGKKFKQYKFMKKTLPDKPVCIGIPPVTSNGKKSGFCLFDTEELSVEAIRI